MLEIEKSFFKIKFSELHFRQRMYQNKSIVTVQIQTEFYPTFAKDAIVSGAVKIQLDVSDLHAIDDLQDKTYQGEVGDVTISILKDGVWEHKHLSHFSISFQKRVGREISFLLETDTCKIEAVATMVSLYTTGSHVNVLQKHFEMKDFYDMCVQRKIGSSTVSRYYVRD